MRTQRFFVTAALVAVLVASGAASVIWVLNSRHTFTAAQLDRPAPPLVLRQADGEAWSLADARGTVVAVYFGYTHCPDVCPLTMANYARAIEQLPSSMRNRVQVVMVTVDPARDTPEVIQRYVTHFSPHFIGLSGTEAEIEAAATAWGAYVERDVPAADGSYAVSHPAYSIVVDQHGRQRLLVWLDITPTQLTHDLEALLKEG